MDEESQDQQPRTLAVDIGGSGIKAIVLDRLGKPLSEKTRVKTPEPATPGALLDVIVESSKEHCDYERVAVGFPGVVRRGVTETAHNLDPAWIGFQLNIELGERLGKPVRSANDADVQGLAVIKGSGVELVLTLGTGLGSALFVDGKLVPNLELAHHPFRKGDHGDTYEDHLGARARKEFGKKRWNDRLTDAITEFRNLFSFDRLYLGGGNAKKVHGPLPEDVETVSNVAGLLGGISLWKD